MWLRTGSVCVCVRERWADKEAAQDCTKPDTCIKMSVVFFLHRTATQRFAFGYSQRSSSLLCLVGGRRRYKAQA